MSSAGSISSLHSIEFRLGLVLYGGVSLAVYENGVAQEFFRAVKGQGVYTPLKKLLNADIVVDIMSGTSAGGINGIMLGYALANNLDFPSSANLWRRDGDILRLLCERYDPSKTLSILDSRGYYQPHLERAYSSMKPYSRRCGDISSSCSELDVFVTGTNVDGRISTTFDDAGHAIDVKDHRQIFVLSYREGRESGKNEFDLEYSAQLATLSRLTSCFPVAFEPVCVKQDDTTLVRWGHLSWNEVPKSVIPRSYYLDGGVLDNKPFSSTIDAIFRRTATRVVDRFLIYVEPDPERFKQVQRTEAPDVVSAGLDALIGIPGYQSIAGDLKNIEHHNDLVERYWEIYVAVRQSFDPAPCTAPPSVDDVSALVDCQTEVGSYLTARFGQLRDHAVDGIIKECGDFKSLSSDEKSAGRVLVQSFDQWKVPEGTLAEFDIFFRMRRLFHLTYRISYFLEKDLCDAYDTTGRKTAPLSDRQREQYQELWLRLNHQIKLLEMLQFAMEQTVARATIPWKELVENQSETDRATLQAIANQKWTLVRDLLLALLDTNGHPAMDAGTKAWSPLEMERRIHSEKKQRDDFMVFLKRRMEELSKQDAAPWTAQGNLLRETDGLEWEVLRLHAPEGLADPITMEYCNFLQLDALLFPMQRLSGMGSLDPLRVIRLSPSDAQKGFSQRDIAEKICGKELAHFSGFFKSSWRANDVMWGRLDAVCQLIETLVTPETLIRGRKGNTWWNPNLWNLDELEIRFPNSTPAECQALLDTIRTVLAGNTAAACDQLKLQLIEIMQREVLAEEVPRVIGEAIRQQREWNNYKVKATDIPALDAGWTWKIGKKEVDEAVTDYAADRLGKEQSPQPGAWTDYMNNVYRVGSESWKTDIPESVLFEILSKAGIGLRSALLTSAGENGKAIQSNVIFKAIFSWPLNLAYRLTNFRRTKPEYANISLAVVFVACFAILTMDLAFFQAIFHNSHGWNGTLLLYLVAVPIGCLAIVLAILYLSKPKRTCLPKNAQS